MVHPPVKGGVVSTVEGIEIARVLLLLLLLMVVMLLLMMMMIWLIPIR